MRLQISLLILCGILAANVSYAQKLRYPYQFIVEFYARERSWLPRKFRCIGAFVSGYSGYNVVTTCTCVKILQYYYILYLREPNGIIRQSMFQHVLRHPKYDWGTKNARIYDIAIVKAFLFGGASAQIPLNAVTTSYKNCRIHTFTVANVIESRSIEIIQLPQCRKIWKGIKVNVTLEETFLCGRTERPKCLPRGFLVECGMRIVGIGLDSVQCCGKLIPYIMYDIRQFIRFLRYNKALKSGAETYGKIDLSIMYLIGILHFIGYESIA